MGAGVTAGGLIEADLLWATARQVDSKLTARIRGAVGGGLAGGGDTAASLETRLTARHGDSGLSRFLLQRQVLFYKVVLRGSFVSACLRERSFCPSACFLFV